mmetsp:Transcript_1160/g.4322  ORF Transcript_1160/g.4322 Transcript_1160/m.4322 type:complete len:351 (+) Transcript_1160:2-1054(+)
MFILDEVTDSTPLWMRTYRWAQSHALGQLFFVSKSWALSPNCRKELEVFTELLLSGMAQSVVFALLHAEFHATAADFGFDDDPRARLREVYEAFGDFATWQEDFVVHVRLKAWLLDRVAQMRDQLALQASSVHVRQAVPAQPIFNLTAIWDWIESDGKRKNEIKKMSGEAQRLAFFLRERYGGARTPEELAEERRAFVSRTDNVDHGFVEREDIPSLPSGYRAWSCNPPARVRNRYTDGAHRLDLNAVGAEELERKLPGIGGTLAQRIVDARPFRDVRELRELDSIGDTTYDDILPFVAVNNGGDGKPRARPDPLYVVAAPDAKEPILGPFATKEAAQQEVQKHHGGGGR